MARKERYMLITGATSGIGFHLAKAASEQGWKVIIHGRNSARVEQAIKSTGAWYGVVGDLRDPESAIRIVDETLCQTEGHLDVLVNNAGITFRGIFHKTSLEILEEVMQVNFWSVLLSTHRALPALIRSQGMLVAISSIAGVVGLPARAIYSASKYAMEGLYSALRKELYGTGVKVLVVRPGFVATEIRKKALTETGRIQGKSPLQESRAISPETVARKILNAIHRKNSVLTIGRFPERLVVLLERTAPQVTARLLWKHFLEEPDSPIHRLQSEAKPHSS